jgi:hypothetical protein
VVRFDRVGADGADDGGVVRLGMLDPAGAVLVGTAAGALEAVAGGGFWWTSPQPMSSVTRLATASPIFASACFLRFIRRHSCLQLATRDTRHLFLNG